MWIFYVYSPSDSYCLFKKFVFAVKIKVMFLFKSIMYFAKSKWEKNFSIDS